MATTTPSRLPLSSLSASEIADLRSTVRDVVEATGGVNAIRAFEDGPAATSLLMDQQAWSTLASDIGLAGLALPEDIGGVGGLPELLAVSEEIGASLLAVPMWSSTVLAGQILLNCDDTAGLERLAAGDLAAAAITDSFGRFTPDGVSVTYDGESLNGSVTFVSGGAEAAFFVVAARGTQGIDVFVVEADAPGVSVKPLETLDFSRSQASVTFAQVQGRAISTAGTGLAALSAAVDVALLALAAEQLGAMQRAFDMTLEYIKIRRQFNREIGSFQAIKHRMADCLALVEVARSAIERTTWTAMSVEELALAASTAKAWCSEAYLAVTSEMVQLHGGIGFTWEHEAHLYFRNARATSALLGDATFHKARIADLLAI